MYTPFFKIHVFIALFLFTSCGLFDREETELPETELDPALRDYISAHTSRHISRGDAIRVHFTRDVIDPDQVNESPKDNPFNISPSIDGTVKWTSPFELTFKPSQWLESGKLYTVTFDVNQFSLSEESLPDLIFQVRTHEQSMDITGPHLQLSGNASGTENIEFTGTVETADLADTTKIRDVFAVTRNGNNLNIDWSFGRTVHEFSIPVGQRTDNEQELKFSWDGSPIGVENEGSKTLFVPAEGDFDLLSMEVVRNPSMHLRLVFSSRLDANQDFGGLVTIQNANQLNFYPTGNVLRIYPENDIIGARVVNIEPGLRNVMNEPFDRKVTRELTFNTPKPQIRQAGAGTIVPSSGKMVFPLEAIGLDQVNVDIVKVFTNNIHQFYQMHGTYMADRNLNHVGRVVDSEVFDLSKMDNHEPVRWKRYHLDLKSFLEPEPGAIYKIYVSFDIEGATMVCEDDSGDDEAASHFSKLNEPERDLQFLRSNPPGFNWRERNNPCHVSYYQPSKWINADFIASNIGITAKSPEFRDDKLYLFLTDINKATPLSGAEVEVYDYQNQLINSGSTNSDGFLELKTKRKPFLVKASKSGSIGYLELANNTLLDMSSFNVSGIKPEKGVQGFLYGEREVWRPGDSIYTGFILKDPDFEIPDGHPILVEFYDPKGNLNFRKVRTKSSKNGNHYVFRYKTDSEDITGRWQLNVTVGHADFSHAINVETIIPNRLDIDLSFDRDELLLFEGPPTGTIKAEWLHGAPASDLETRVKATVRESELSFSDFKKFRFNDPAGYFGPTEQSILESDLNSSGETNFPLEFSFESMPGALESNFEVRVFEPGGGFSRQQFTYIMHPFRQYTGISTPDPAGNRRYLDGNTAWDIDLVLIDHEGNAVNNGNIEVAVFEMDWRWWWSRSNENLKQYTQGGSAEPLEEDSVSVRNGSATYNLDLTDRSSGGRYYIRACDRNGGHCTGEIVYIGRPSLAQRGRTEQAEGLKWLGVVTDQIDYKTGDDVTVTVPVEQKSNALITIEKDDKILHREWKKNVEGQFEYTFKADGEMAPNVYVHVSVFTPYESTVNDMPARLYGVVPVSVYDPETKLNPVIDAPEKLRPKETTTVSISENDGKEMQYTLAIVDEGLLNLTGFRTPNPHDKFFAKRALQMETRDMYDRIMGALGGDIQGLAQAGGGLRPGDVDQGESIGDRFDPVVKFLGPFTLEAGETREHSFTLPQYIGRARVMVVASGDNAYGKAEERVFIRSPLMVLGSLPRMAGPGETYNVPVHIWAYDHAAGDVQVHFSGDEFFEVVGNPFKTVTFNENGRETVYFQLNTAEKTGTGAIKIEATGGGETELYSTKFEVRNTNPEVTESSVFVLEAGESVQDVVESFGISGTSEGWIEVSAIPPLDLSRRLNSLIRYPHGCLEQTVSGAFPQLYIAGLTDVTTEQKREMDENVRQAIIKMSRFSTSNGGLSLWQGNNRPHDWASIYAGHFLVSAQNEGFEVPSSVMMPLIKYLQNQISRSPDGPYERFAHSYILYVLALEGSPNWSAMNRLRNHPRLSDPGRWRLAAAYKISGRDDAASGLIREASKEWSPPSYSRQTFGSELRNRAMVLETMGLMGMRSEGYELFEYISRQLQDSRRWHSTQTTAYSLIALSTYAGKFIDQDMHGSLTVDGEHIDLGQYSGMVRKELNFKSGGKSEYSVENQGDGILHISVYNKGIPLPEDGIPKAASNDMNLEVRYLSGDKTIDPAQLERGQDFEIEVKVQYNGVDRQIDNVALSHIMPSGWEITGLRLGSYRHEGESPMDFRDVRDDRVYTYFSLTRNDEKTFRIPVNASYSGRYFIPGIQVEAMYDGDVNAVVPGKWINVD